MEQWKGGFLVCTPYPGLGPSSLSLRRLQGAERGRHSRGRYFLDQRISRPVLAAS
jgi:hypothetical protein